MMFTARLTTWPNDSLQYNGPPNPFRSPLPGPSTPKHEDMEGKDNIDNTSRISRPRHDAMTATDAQRKPRREVPNSDERIASSVNGRAEKGEGAIAEEGDVPKEQETSKNAGGAQAQRIMDELNDSARMAKKIAELQQPKLQQKKSQQQKLKQQVSNIGKHLEEQRALEEQLENRNAEIDRLRVDLAVERTHSQEKDAEINQLRDSLRSESVV